MADDKFETPALTAEQWKTLPRVYFREPIRYEQEGRTVTADEGYGIELASNGEVQVWDDSWALTVAPEDRHAAAAILLHEQSFGFTPEDVRGLRMIAGAHGHLISEAIQDLADRIAHLLPPKP